MNDRRRFGRFVRRKSDFRTTIPTTIGIVRRSWSAFRRSYYPQLLSAQIGPDFSPIGSVYWYTVKSTNPNYDLMELKSLQDWTITKYIKSAPDTIVDASSFGGLTLQGISNPGRS